ncbi:hypothetical protein lilo_0730 [Lactococcus lactis subsp. lactis IO-1]|jgi:hypothetical protein|nr:hypothetical protein lilo_0730 [Lactococcus lactis subsp. lactis IO-1]
MEKVPMKTKCFLGYGEDFMLAVLGMIIEVLNFVINLVRLWLEIKKTNRN